MKTNSLKNALPATAFTILVALIGTASDAAATTRIYLDFGRDWGAPNAVAFDEGCNGLIIGAPNCSGTDYQISEAPWNGPSTPASTPRAMNPSWWVLHEAGLDYNGDGKLDERFGVGNLDHHDTDALAADVAELIERIYEPFDVEVVLVNASTLEDISATLASTSSKDAYILIGSGGAVLPYGVAQGPPDFGNALDNVALVYLDKRVFKNSDASAVVWVGALAKTIAHEAAHTFGLVHVTGGGDVMYRYSTSDAAPASQNTISTFSRQPQPFHGTNADNPRGEAGQNSYDTLARVLGLRSNMPAYVTGTGHHDTIELDHQPPMVVVTVSSYRNPARTQLSSSTSYKVSDEFGVIVEAGAGNDMVDASKMTKSVVLRGDAGDDELIGGAGDDVLDGGTGDDLLEGRAGDDTYAFDGFLWVVYSKPYQDRYTGHLAHDAYTLGADRLEDAEGNDTVDFGRFGRPAEIDLESPQQQLTSRVIGFPFYVPPSPYNRILRGAFHHLTLVGGGRPSPGRMIENAIGSAFSDLLYGNALNNQLWGGGGSDSIYGRGGDDSISGGAGYDYCYDNPLPNCESNVIGTVPTP